MISSLHSLEQNSLLNKLLVLITEIGPIPVKIWGVGYGREPNLQSNTSLINLVTSKLQVFNVEKKSINSVYFIELILFLYCNDILCLENIDFLIQNIDYISEIYKGIVFSKSAARFAADAASDVPDHEQLQLKAQVYFEAVMIFHAVKDEKQAALPLRDSYVLCPLPGVDHIQSYRHIITKKKILEQLRERKILTNALYHFIVDCPDNIVDDRIKIFELIELIEHNLQGSRLSSDSKKDEKYSSPSAVIGSDARPRLILETLMTVSACHDEGISVVDVLAAFEIPKIKDFWIKINSCQPKRNLSVRMLIESWVYIFPLLNMLHKGLQLSDDLCVDVAFSLMGKRLHVKNILLAAKQLHERGMSEYASDIISVFSHDDFLEYDDIQPFSDLVISLITFEKTQSSQNYFVSKILNAMIIGVIDLNNFYRICDLIFYLIDNNIFHAKYIDVFIGERVLESKFIHGKLFSHKNLFLVNSSSIPTAASLVDDSKSQITSAEKYLVSILKHDLTEAFSKKPGAVIAVPRCGRLEENKVYFKKMEMLNYFKKLNILSSQCYEFIVESENDTEDKFEFIYLIKIFLGQYSLGKSDNISSLVALVHNLIHLLKAGVSVTDVIAAVNLQVISDLMMNHDELAKIRREANVSFLFATLGVLPGLSNCFDARYLEEIAKYVISKPQYAVEYLQAFRVLVKRKNYVSADGPSKFLVPYADYIFRVLSLTSNIAEVINAIFMLAHAELNGLLGRNLNVRILNLLFKFPMHAEKLSGAMLRLSDETYAYHNRYDEKAISSHSQQMKIVMHAFESRLLPLLESGKGDFNQFYYWADLIIFLSSNGIFSDVYINELVNRISTIVSIHAEVFSAENLFGELDVATSGATHTVLASAVSSHYAQRLSDHECHARNYFDMILASHDSIAMPVMACLKKTSADMYRDKGYLSRYNHSLNTILNFAGLFPIDQSLRRRQAVSPDFIKKYLLRTPTVLSDSTISEIHRVVDIDAKRLALFIEGLRAHLSCSCLMLNTRTCDSVKAKILQQKVAALEQIQAHSGDSKLLPDVSILYPLFTYLIDLLNLVHDPSDNWIHHFNLFSDFLNEHGIALRDFPDHQYVDPYYEYASLYYESLSGFINKLANQVKPEDCLELQATTLRLM